MSQSGGDDAHSSNELTDRQQEALDFIGHYIHRHGYPPTLREIGEKMKIRSTNGVNDHLKALEKKGYLEREDLKSRALRPIVPDNHNGNHNGNHGSGASHGKGARSESHFPSLTGQLVDVPLLGRVAAGEPILAVEMAEDTVKVDRFFLGSATREVFALRVKGDSMIEAGIYDNDFIFVKKQVTANRGDIVVAIIDGDATVKYYHPEPDQIRFKPANHRLSDIIVRKRDWKSVNLLGLVVGVYRKL